MRRLFFLAAALACSGCHDTATTTNPTAADERAHPATYLKVNYEVRKNLIGKKVVEGKVLHTGKYLTYNTVTLRIDCYKNGNNNTVTYTIPEALKPGGTQSFKFKPEGSPDKIKVSVSEASAD